MHILFLVHNVAWRGSFFRGYHWGRHLARRGHQVTIAATSKSARLSFEAAYPEGVCVLQSPDLLWGRLRTGWDLWNIMRRTARLLREPFDIVHSIDCRPVCILPALALKWRRPQTMLILDWLDWWGHGGTIVERPGNLADRLFAPVETFFEEHFRTRADASLTVSTALMERAVALGVPASSVTTIPFGADIEAITPRPQREARRALGLDPCTPIIGYVGMLFRRDAQMLIEATEHLVARVPGVRLLVIGNSNILVPPHLLASGAVKVTGSLSYHDLQTYISACDLMLLPMKNSIANRGRWPSKVCDYFASGRAVVVTRVGDVAALAGRAECGIVTGDTPEEFADGVQAALGNKAALDRMGANARKVASEELDWSLLTDRLERFYRSAFSCKANSRMRRIQQEA